MTANNPNQDLVNINAYVKFGEICQFVLNILNGNKILAYYKGHSSGRNVQKIMFNNQKLDLFNKNAYMKFGEILTIGFQDIKRKRNSCVIQGDITLVQTCK